MADIFKRLSDLKKLQLELRSSAVGIANGEVPALLAEITSFGNTIKARAHGAARDIHDEVGRVESLAEDNTFEKEGDIATATQRSVRGYVFVNSELEPFFSNFYFLFLV